MSGHSKWSTIKRQKEAKDAKKGAAFTKLAAAITVAVRSGGGGTNPEENFHLRLAVEKARQFNMPKENIARAIEKGAGTGGEGGLAEVMFEGFAPGGVAVLVEGLTDNKLRTAQAVRTVFDKSGGVMGGSGSVGYLFVQKGELRSKLRAGNSKSLQDQELEIIDSGAEDIEEDGVGGWVVYCDPKKTFAIREQLVKMGYAVEAQLVRKPMTLSEVGDTGMKDRVEKTLEQLEETDDVTHVWTNYSPV